MEVGVIDKKKSVSLALVIIWCINAVILNINLLLDLIRGYASTGTLILHIVCAIAWDICAIAWVLYYLKSKKTQNLTYMKHSLSTLMILVFLTLLLIWKLNLAQAIRNRKFFLN